MTETKTNKSRPRPLSPHLQVYKPQITSLMSITHRATGVALYIGAFLFAAYLFKQVFYPESFCPVAWFISTSVGKIALFGYTFALFYHLFNGLRHLGWDIGLGFDIPTVYKTGYAVLAASGILTILFWVL
jgi:succinate dehydrogenase / fumarate reductase cytochrome b subunit